jgi:hypothetical protein
VINHFFSGPFQQILKQKNKSYSKGRSDLQTTHVTLYLAKLFLSSGERGLVPRRVPPVLGNRLGSLFHIPHAQENIYFPQLAVTLHTASKSIELPSSTITSMPLIAT